MIVRYKGGTLGTNQQKKQKKKTQAFRSSLLLYFVLFTQYNCFCLSDNGVGMVAENAVILFKVQTLHGARTQSWRKSYTSQHWLPPRMYIIFLIISRAMHTVSLWFYLLAWLHCRQNPFLLWALDSHLLWFPQQSQTSPQPGSQPGQHAELPATSYPISLVFLCGLSVLWSKNVI